MHGMIPQVFGLRHACRLLPNTSHIITGIFAWRVKNECKHYRLKRFNFPSKNNKRLLCTFAVLKKIFLAARNIIRLQAYLLLLVYMAGVAPSVILHHHQDSVVMLQHASQCEKSIYYNDYEGSCKHKQHLSKEPEKCLLCSHHTVMPQILLDLTNHVKPLQEYSLQYCVCYENVPVVPLNHSTSRGPPQS